MKKYAIHAVMLALVASLGLSSVAFAKHHRAHHFRRHHVQNERNAISNAENGTTGR